MMETFYYNFANQTFLCIETPSPNATTLEDAVQLWVATASPESIALTLFQLHFAANISVPAYGALPSEEEVLDRRRRRLEEDMMAEVSPPQLSAVQSSLERFRTAAPRSEPLQTACRPSRRRRSSTTRSAASRSTKAR